MPKPPPRCRWCNRACTPDAEGYCKPECRAQRDRIMAPYPEAREHTPEFAVHPEGYIHFAGGFFDELRGLLGDSKPESLSFVMGSTGQYGEWCDLLSVPKVEDLTSHLMAQWGVPYLQYYAVVRPPQPPKVVSGKLAPRCATCGTEDEEKFNRRGDGYRSYCRDCDASSLRDHRAKRKVRLQERKTA